MKTAFKLNNGNEVIIGLNIYNKWTVSCWDIEYNIVWQQEFSDENSAREYFDRVELNS